MKTLPFITGCLLLLTLGTFISCQTIPEYDNTPRIEYKTIERCFSFDENGGKKDSLIIVTRFEDGDGDLGLSTADLAQPPFNEARTYNDKNYFIEVFVKRNGSFVKFDFPIIYETDGVTPQRNKDGTIRRFNFYSTFLRLSPDDRIGPIEGDLRFVAIELRENFPFKAGDILKFRVYVVDRKFNKSNEIETDEIVLFTGQSNGACQ